MFVLTTYALASAYFTTCLGGVVSRQVQPSSPFVTLKNGSYAGLHSPQYDQDFFLGLPYAQKAERFTPAESLKNHWHDMRSAWQYPKHCVGYGGDEVGYELSEDCLYLNVVRPAGLETNSGLPVAVWIHGGGLVSGGSADRRYNMSFIVAHSVDMGTPVIGVSINYRLSAYGFLGGQQALAAGATNIGFRDQRLALQWVHENIGAFGGDPGKVTIFGESSGAESVAAQVFAYNGRDDGLFRGAIGESGFGSELFRTPGGLNATDAYQELYDRFVNTTSCADLVGKHESLACLKALPFEEVNQVLNGTFNSTRWAPVMDGDFIQEYPSVQIKNGNFPKIPIIIGQNSDEGTSFGPHGFDSDQDLAEALNSMLIPSWVKETTGKSAEELVAEILAVYPNNQSVGVPSLKTWPDVIEPGTDFATEYGLQYRRSSAIFGDSFMFYARRNANIGWSKYGLSSYAYRFDVTIDSVPESTGATHFQEVAFVFMNYNGDGYATNPFSGPASYQDKAKALSRTMGTAWVNFFVSLDPNSASGKLSGIEPAWPVYDASVGDGVGQEVVWSLNDTHVGLDDYRKGGIQWMMDHMLTVFGY